MAAVGEAVFYNSAGEIVDDGTAHGKLIEVVVGKILYYLVHFIRLLRGMQSGREEAGGGEPRRFAASKLQKRFQTLHCAGHESVIKFCMVRKFCYFCNMV